MSFRFALMQLAFAGAIFFSALLLFVVEPLVGKMLLPWLGGTPGVWNTCLVFFQAVLLLGYLYAHLTTTWLGTRRQAVLHFAVLALVLVTLPIALPADLAPPASDSDQPFGWVFLVLVGLVGLPFFAVSTTGPLLQRWFAGTGHPSARDPYFLYAASNLGSLLALLAYPIAIEPQLSLAGQSRDWTVVYGAFVVMAVVCALILWKSRPEAEAARQFAETTPDASPKPTGLRRLRWIGLAFVPSSLLMGVTTHLSTDIAAIPLLWVVPLTLYLASFILVFAKRPPLSHALMGRLLPLAVVLLAIPVAAGSSEPIWLVLPLDLATFFLAAMVCHGELARDRPPASHLTEYYLWMSFGGVLGGLFNALAAPVLFRHVGLVEYPLAIVLAVLLRRPLATDSTAPPGRRRALDVLIPLVVGGLTAGLLVLAQRLELKDGSPRTLLVFGLPAMVVFACADRPLRFGLALAALFVVGGFGPSARGTVLHFERNFFGFVRVIRDPEERFNLFIHGTTIHGQQCLDPGLRLEPTTYYTRTGPLNDAFATFNATAERRKTQDVGIIGLGAGGMCCYRLDQRGQPRHPGQKWTYYEIDPAVVRVARDERYFTFLTDCFPDDRSLVQIVLGDGRLRLREAPDCAYGLLILDAFSSDAIPVHLLTREAMQLYVRKLAPGGLLVMNISNRYLHLKPVVAGLAAAEGLEFRSRDNFDVVSEAPENQAVGKKPSQWVVMTRTTDDLGQIGHDPCWLRFDHPTILWTDDFSNIVGVLRPNLLQVPLVGRP